MAYRWIFQRAVLLLTAALIIPFENVFAEDNEFPERTRFYMVKWISGDDLYAKMKSVDIVDVRSKYEYETLHIAGAHNIVLGSPHFIDDVKKLAGETKKSIIFYCNGHTCRKSYEAARDAQNAGIANVFAYDAGILSWAKKFPDQSVLLGKSPMPPSNLISKEKLQAHMLSPNEFGNKIDKSTSIVLDVRDDFQQDGVALYPLIQRSVPLDNNALQKYIDQALREKKTLMIFDATGHQVSWLQYYLEAQKVPSYYFMKGGAKAFYDGLTAAMQKR